MAWKLHFVVCCITIVVSSPYKFPIHHQPLQLAAFRSEDDQQYLNSRSDYERPNVRSQETNQDYRMHERSINSNSRRQSQVVIEPTSTYLPQVEESTKRSDNVSSKVLKNILKPIIRRGQVNNNKIIFPGPTVSSIKSSILTIPESCKSSTFCEDIPNYPQEDVNRIISELDGRFSFLLDKMEVPDTPDINQRLGPAEENLNLCESQEKVVYPLAAKGADDNWYTLINRKDNPLQGFKIELCQPDKPNCSNIVFFQNQYEGRCVQKYVYRNAVVIENVGDTTRKLEIPVKMPSCCSCVARTKLT